MVEIILLILLPLITAVSGFLSAFIITKNHYKGMIEKQSAFDHAAARTLYITYLKKEPNQEQIRRMIEAYRRNK
jgi:uncharacterized protein YneF (UPF0154 family)